MTTTEPMDWKPGRVEPYADGNENGVQVFDGDGIHRGMFRVGSTLQFTEKDTKTPKKKQSVAGCYPDMGGLSEMGAKPRDGRPRLARRVLVIGWPKPKPPPREPGKRKGIARGKKPKHGNAYTTPEWRALVRIVKRRSKGVRESQVACAGDPAVGDPHHTLYLPLKGKKRVLVDPMYLIAVCRRCHLQLEREKP